MNTTTVTKTALEALKKTELVSRCKVAGIKASSSMRKGDLIRAILKHSQATVSPPPAQTKGVKRKFADDITNVHRSKRAKATTDTKEVVVEDAVLIIKKSEPQSSTIVDDLRNENAALKVALAAANEAIASLEATSTSHETMLAAADARIATLESMFLKLQHKVDGLPDAARKEPVTMPEPTVDSTPHSYNGDCVDSVCSTTTVTTNLTVLELTTEPLIIRETNDADAANTVSSTTTRSAPRKSAARLRPSPAPASTAASSPARRSFDTFSSAPRRRTPSKLASADKPSQRSTVVTPPPTPPAPTTMFGTERETDTRFGDEYWPIPKYTSRW